jgi:glycosyltransferase involved in cell wall biosynthesis
VARLLQACDFIVSSSAFGEGFSNAIAEGMACGLPAIATDVGDARRILGGTGVVVPPGDVRALIDGIRRLAGEPSDQRAKRADAARARIVECFSLPAAVSRFAAFYRSVSSVPLLKQRYKRPS